MPTDWATADVRLKQRSYAQVQLRLLLLLPCLAMAMAAGAAAETATPRTIAHGMAPGRIAGEQRVVGFPCNPPRTAGGRLSFENCEDDISRNRGESGARDFLRHYGEALGLDGGGSDLELVEVKHGLASTSSRFI